MTTTLQPVVEGQGDGISLPIVFRRLAAELGAGDVRVARPMRIPRDKLVRRGELERAIERAARMIAPGGSVLIVLDGDGDPPCQLGPALQERAHAARPDIRSAVVVAHQEKEAWFLAAAASLRGHRGLPEDLERPPHPEGIRGAKEWLARAMKRPYSEITDQASLSATFSLEEARRHAPSFDKLWRELERLLTAENGALP